MTGDIDSEAANLLRRMVGAAAEFRDQQLEAIRRLVERRQRVLLVQRTGWGKSAVYFIATRLLRDRGSGPTLLISPLLALMRNQIAMADRAGVRADTINSANRDVWGRVAADLRADRLDLLLVSPERLNNPAFRDQLRTVLAPRTGLLVIDEVHCISDWGHDFRPDYRRVGSLLRVMPGKVPVLCSTATANDRVVADVTGQIPGLVPLRGPLDRASLVLDAFSFPAQATRLAWLAAAVPRLPGSGIVYCLTIADTHRVASWLRRQGIDAEAYSGDTPSDAREVLEQRLLGNKLKALVATSALGMGFDKPDLGFVIHYQSPGSPIAYYQQVGRAGRALPTSYGVLLSGSEDSDIQDYFIRTAFPDRDQAEQVIGLLADAAEPMTLRQIESRVNVRHSRLDAMLKILEVEGAAEKVGAGWLRTLNPWSYDADRVEHVTAVRRAEQRAMREYVATPACLMAFLRRQLDDPDMHPCGRCRNCAGSRLPSEVDPQVVQQATRHLRSQWLEIEPRRQWPAGLDDLLGRIPPDHQLEPGRALGFYGDGGWGSIVRRAKFTDEHFDDALVEAAAELVDTDWAPLPRPAWVTFVPSRARPALVADFARRLAAALDLRLVAAVATARDTRPQKEMHNSAQQLRNVKGAFAVSGCVPAEPVLLVDDIVDSRWTLTIVGAALRQAGSGPVYPFALASATSA